MGYESVVANDLTKNVCRVKTCSRLVQEYRTTAGLLARPTSIPTTNTTTINIRQRIRMMLTAVLEFMRAVRQMPRAAMLSSATGKYKRISKQTMAHRCPKCDAEFSTNQKLQRHLQRKRPCDPIVVGAADDPCVCDHCGRRYSRVDSCKRHRGRCRILLAGDGEPALLRREISRLRSAVAAPVVAEPEPTTAGHLLSLLDAVVYTTASESPGEGAPASLLTYVVSTIRRSPDSDPQADSSISVHRHVQSLHSIGWEPVGNTDEFRQITLGGHGA